MKDYSYNFQPAIKCPRCGNINHPCISGFGAELSSRGKVCKYCGLEYTVLILSVATTNNITTPEYLSSLKKKIVDIKKRIETKIANKSILLINLSKELMSSPNNN